MNNWLQDHQWIAWVTILLGLGINSIKMLFMTYLSREDKRVIRKTFRFYEDVGCYLAEHSSKPEVIKNDLLVIKQLKEKIK